MALNQDLHKNNLITSYHDKSDGGLFVTLSEMALAGNKSVVIDKSLERYYSDNLMKNSGVTNDNFLSQNLKSKGFTILML